jgi:membrane protease YdiL (CAAX protease family)
MLLNDLTANFSKQTIFLLLIATVFIDIVLYFTKYSYFMDNIYDMLTLITFFVGIELHRRITNEISKENDKKWIYRFAVFIKKFANVFLIFVIANFIVDLCSTNLLPSYWENFDSQVTYYDETISQFEESIPPAATSEEHLMNFFSIVDMVGFDFLSSILAGSEEIWRLSYIVLLLLILKKLFPRHWSSQNQKLFIGITVGITSLLFGIGHTLAYDYNFSLWIGTVIIYSLLGLVLCLLLLWTRNLWLLVTVHAFYDVIATLSWHYIPWAVWYTAAILVLCRIFSAVILRE